MNKKNLLFAGAIAIALLFSCKNPRTGILPEEDSSDFVLVTDVVPDAILEIRYYSSYNFIGNRIPGYEEPVALLTRRAADSLKAVSDELLQQGYRLKIFDAYRPQCAVDYFMKWAKDTSDVRMKAYFYPELDKSVLVPQEYIAEKSGHTRGSTIDLTLFDMKAEREVDMGCTYDYFGIASHPDVLPGQEIGAYKPITEEQYHNRMILREAMLRHGFKPYDCEWWHFTLENEPYPDTYFTFPISTQSVTTSNARRAPAADNDTMFQVATLQSLMIGNYDGFINVGELRSRGDFGLGTFESINGEMIILNDTVFQAKHDGSVAVADDGVMVPFAVATHFDSDIQITVDGISCLDSLLNRITNVVNANGSNLIYAVRIDVSDCDVVEARSELPQQRPYKPLAEALKTDQREFSFRNISGTIVGVYFPDYLGQLNATGWHCHFISADRSHGGHLFGITTSQTATVHLDPTPAFMLHMPEEKSFANARLNEDLSAEIEAVEK